MTYSDALAALKAGKSITRPALGAGVTVFLVKSVNGADVSEPWFAQMRPGMAGFMPWPPQPGDQLAEDWTEVAS